MVHYFSQSSRIEALAQTQYLSELAGSWLVVSLDDLVLDRASRPLAGPIIRTIDALHVASALELARAFGCVELFSFDERVRACAVASGLTVTPTLI